MSTERRRQGPRLERIVRERWRAPGGIRALSYALGVSRATLYSWFRGDTSPNTATLARLAELLDMAPSELLESLQPERALPRSAADAGIPTARMESFAMSAYVIGPVIGNAVRGREVSWCDADDPVGPAARRMYESNYSQMPVRDRDRWIGLLTGEAIARWMAGRARRRLEVDDAAPVREVLAYAEGLDDFVLVGPDEGTDSVIAVFRERAVAGAPLAAALVVADGRPDGDLLGIVTPADLPELRVRRSS